MHDYNPEWDYQLERRPSKKVRSVVDDVLSSLEENGLYKKVGIDKPTVFYSPDIKGVALYIDGTIQQPVIGINSKHTQKICKECDLDIGTGIETSILHEIAHAIEDSQGKKYNEERAEDFARDYYDFRDVPNWMVGRRKGKQGEWAKPVKYVHLPSKSLCSYSKCKSSSKPRAGRMK